MRIFKQISQEQWDKDFDEYENKINYNKHKLPIRGSKGSAGYDFFSPIDITIPAHEAVKIPTGIKAYMEPGDVLMLYPRSSIGFKTNIRLSNVVGIIDEDFADNRDNEGHIWVKFYNPTDNPYNIYIGDRIVQGIFTKFLITDDDTSKDERFGGIGSTGK